MSSQLPADEPDEPSPTMGDTHAGETHGQRVARLFREHNESLLRYLRTLLPSDEAKEVAQEAYVQVLGLDHPETVHLLERFLYRTATNIAKNRQKQWVRRHRIDELVFFETADDRSPERVCTDDGDLAVVLRALNELPANCREAFRLVRLEELSIDEAAQRLELTPRQIRRLIARALAYCLAEVESQRTHGGLP